MLPPRCRTASGMYGIFIFIIGTDLNGARRIFLHAFQ